MTSSKSDIRRTTRFREEARAIVKKDRNDRKYGFKVDTAGAIARAMERAYKEGFQAGQEPEGSTPPTNDEVLYGERALEWDLIPPRPRTAFWSICLFVFGMRDISDAEMGQFRMTPTISERGTPAWQMPEKRGVHDEFGERTMIPLVRLGLLSFVGEPEPILILTERAWFTWKRYIEEGGEFP